MVFFLALSGGKVRCQRHSMSSLLEFDGFGMGEKMLFVIIFNYIVVEEPEIANG